MKKLMPGQEWYGQHRTLTIGGLALCILALSALVPIAVYRSLASTAASALEPELGSPSTNISITTDSTAANGKYVQFTAGSGGGGTVTLPNPGAWTNVSGNLPNELFYMGVAPSGSKVYAGLVNGQAGAGIYVNTSGNTWTKTGTGSGSATVGSMPVSMTFDPANPNNMWIPGIYGSFVSYKTTDGGNTYQQLGNFGVGDYVAVDFTDSARKTLIAGPHETNKKVMKSTDGGNTWNDVGGGLPNTAGFMTEPIVINASTYVVDSSWSWNTTDPSAQNPILNAIYRTVNGGSTWSKVSDEGVSHRPFYSQRTGTIIYFGTINYSTLGDHLLRSTDGGLTWTKISGHSFASAPIELPDGRLVTLSDTHFMISTDNGSTWANFGAAFPCSLGNGASFGYSPGQSAFFLGDDGCNGGKV